MSKNMRRICVIIAASLHLYECVLLKEEKYLINITVTDYSAFINYICTELKLNVLQLAIMYGTVETSVLDEPIDQLFRTCNIPLTIQDTNRNLPQTYPGNKYIKYSHFLLILSDVNNLAAILSQVRKTFYWNGRGKMYVQFINCTLSRKELHSVFKIFWQEKILTAQIIVTKFNSSVKEYSHFVSYNPFINQIIVKKINPMTHGTVTRNDYFSNELLEEVTKNLYGYPLRVSVYNILPYIWLQETKKGEIEYSGFSGKIFQTVKHNMNLTPILVEKYQPRLVNRKLPNGTWVGPLGEVITAFSDICPFPMMMFQERFQILDYSVVFYFNGFVFVSPKALKIPQWKSLLLPFDVSIWFSVFAILIYAFVSDVVIHWFMSTAITFQKVIGRALYVLSLYLQGTVASAPKKGALRIVMILCLLGAMIINSLYQGALLSCMITPRYGKDLDSFEDIAKSGLTVTGLPQFLALLNLYDSPVLKILSSRSVVITNPFQQMHEVASKRNSIYFGLETTVLHEQQLYKTSDDEYLLHILKQRVGSVWGAFILPKDSPYVPRMNVIIQRLFEAGFVSKWEAQSLHVDTALPTISHIDNKADVSLSLHHIQTAYYLFVTGIIFSVLTFVLEVFFAQLVKFCTIIKETVTH